MFQRNVMVSPKYALKHRVFSSVRKDILPVIKLIHPDLFVDSQVARRENLLFLQGLNELVDNLDNLKLNCRQSLGLDVKTPLFGIYKFSFYVRGNEGTGLEKITLSIQTPKELTVRQSVSYTVGTRLLKNMLYRLGSLHSRVGITNPWADDETTRNNNSENNSKYYSEIKNKNSIDVNDPSIQEEINKRVMEKIVVNKSRISLFHSSTNSDHACNYLITEVNSFIANGNILISNMTIEEELDCVERFRFFLLNYGHLLSFSSRKWYTVLFVIDGKRKSKKDTLYTSESIGKRNIVTIPFYFKKYLLLKFLSKELPQSNFWDSGSEINMNLEKDDLN
jgi:hypothetical protein